MKSPYTIAISSFAVHGVASLKAFITILGERILPVPSLLLNGLTNMALVKTFDLSFNELLTSTFDLAVSRNMELLLYIGYLGHAGQVDSILEAIEKYRGNIKRIITDPVCGDHGRVYVPHEIIARWPDLIAKSNVVFPNSTELKILTGFQGEDRQPVAVYVRKFQAMFPETRLVVTSLETESEAPKPKVGIAYYGNETYSFFHPKLSRNYGGSGDVFLAYYILHHYYSHLGAAASIKLAAEQTSAVIARSIAHQSDDLLI